MKSILKLIYVVVLPLAVLLSPVYLTVAHELSYTVVLVITIVTLINAIFWLFNLHPYLVLVLLYLKQVIGR
jgi:hypothetical protein